MQVLFSERLRKTINPGVQSEPGEVTESVTSHYSRSNLLVYIGKCMKEDSVLINSQVDNREE